jgi:hypothetical protein
MYSGHVSAIFCVVPSGDKSSPGTSEFSASRQNRSTISMTACAPRQAGIVPAGASGLAKLVKLAVQGLPVGADAGIADEAFFGVISGISYANRNPLISQGR